MKILFVFNDASYGTEKTYNALRLVIMLQKEHPNTEISIFLIGDAVTSALPGQNTPNGYYNIERMLKVIIAGGVKVKLCGSCTDARGLRALNLIEGVEISNIHELAQLTTEADKILTF
jgi:uncharacterized protein involved in oxidation of intracellular sulfur